MNGVELPGLKMLLTWFWLSGLLSGIWLAPVQADDLMLGTPALASDQAEQQSLEARGVLLPGAEAVLASQIAAQVVALPFKAGDSFAAGDVLVRLDCGFYEAQLSAAQAAATAARIQLQSDQQLAQLNSIGALEVQLSEARWRQAEAEVKLNQVLADRCIVKAPFAGRVVERLIHPHESVTPDVKMLSIVARTAPDIRLVVPSHWLAWLRQGSRFRFQVDETGQVLPAKVTAVGARIDAVSQTISVRAAFDGRVEALTPGMSGTARFEPQATAKVR